MHRVILLVLVLAPIWCGCKTRTGPRFDPRQAPPVQGTLSVTNLTVPAFMPVQSSNVVNPQWLKRPEEPFRVGPGDLMEIEVLGESGITSPALVGPDGRIYYDLLPGTFVWGLTMAEIKAVLEDNLAKYLRMRPSLLVSLKKVGSQRVWVLGSVQRPGVYSLSTPMTILEALAIAGGTTIAQGSSQEVADLRHSFVMREGKMLPVDLYDLLRNGDLNQNVYLRADDFIYVRPGASQDIYVLGAVAQPNIVPAAADTSLLYAVANVGGPIRYAYLSQVAIIRGSLSRPMIAFVNYQDIAKGRAPDVRLEQGDIVYVPYRPTRKVEQFAEGALNDFVRALAIREGQNAVLRNGNLLSITSPGR